MQLLQLTDYILSIIFKFLFLFIWISVQTDVLLQGGLKETSPYRPKRSANQNEILDVAIQSYGLEIMLI